MAPNDSDSAVQDTPKTTRVTKRLAASKAKAALHKAANLKTAVVLTPPDSPDKLSATPKTTRRRASPKAKRDASPHKLDAGDPPTKERKKAAVRKPRAKTEVASKRGVKPARSAILRKTGAGALKKKVAFSEAEDVSIEIEHSPSGTRSFCSIM